MAVLASNPSSKEILKTFGFIRHYVADLNKVPSPENFVNNLGDVFLGMIAVSATFFLIKTDQVTFNLLRKTSYSCPMTPLEYNVGEFKIQRTFPIGVGVKSKVLDVGQCNADNYRITKLLEQHFDVQIDRSHSLKDAIESASNTTYDLILINRLLDADGSAGMDVLASLKSGTSSAEIPVMIVSNYQDAQDLAVQNGAVAGFGKADLETDETLTKLKQYLSEPK